MLSESLEVYAEFSPSNLLSLVFWRSGLKVLFIPLSGWKLFNSTTAPVLLTKHFSLLLPSGCFFLIFAEFGLEVWRLWRVSEWAIFNVLVSDTDCEDGGSHRAAGAEAVMWICCDSNKSQASGASDGYCEQCWQSDKGKCCVKKEMKVQANMQK